MKRRDFLKVSGAAVIATQVPGTPVEGSPQEYWNLSDEYLQLSEAKMAELGIRESFLSEEITPEQRAALYDATRQRILDTEIVFHEDGTVTLNAPHITLMSVAS